MNLKSHPKKMGGSVIIDGVRDLDFAMLLTWVAVVGLFGVLRAVHASAQAPAATAFVNVSVIPMDRERVLVGQTVLIEGARITALGPVGKVWVPAGAVRIDGRGKSLLPGLGNMHAHLPMDSAGIRTKGERDLLYALRQGVTTIRVMTGIPETVTLRERVARGEVWGPRIYTSGPKVFGPLSAAAAVAEVKRQHAAGYDFIKHYGGFEDAAVFDSAMAAAQRLGIPVAGHALDNPDRQLNNLTLEQLGRWRFATIEHLSGYGTWLIEATGHRPYAVAADGRRQFSRDSLIGNLRHVTDSALAALAVATKRAGLWNCPTLAAYQIAAPEWKALLSRLLPALHQAGAGLLLGTDGSLNNPGWAVSVELKLLVEMGLTPYQALETGTWNVAAFFGALDSTGTVAVGKQADLVLLDADPLADIANVAQVAGVMRRGRWYARPELEARLAALDKEKRRVGNEP